VTLIERWRASRADTTAANILWDCIRVTQVFKTAGKRASATSFIVEHEGVLLRVTVERLNENNYRDPRVRRRS
jgi:hypothetical protein